MSFHREDWNPFENTIESQEQFVLLPIRGGVFPEVERQQPENKIFQGVGYE